MEPLENVLDINDLHVTFSTYGGTIKAVRGVSFRIHKGETLTLVGESGCGKSVTANAIMRLIPDPPGKIARGKIMFNGMDLARRTEREMRRIRGVDISMIFQDPMTALNPTLSIGTQLLEGIKHHRNLSTKQAKQKALEMMHLVGIPNPDERLKHYPHQFSGGMRQRIVIAMALICEPQLLIADEPTTALDVTIQAQILDLFAHIQKETGVAIILITHDLGVVAQIADRIAVMYAGKIIETGTKRDIFYRAEHPYTKGLLHSVPRLDRKEEQLIPIDGTPPDLFAPPQGCPFTARCPFAMEVCDKLYPVHTRLSATHRVDCWLQDERAKQLLAQTAGK